MPGLVGTLFNRTYQQLVIAANVPTSFNIVDLKCDPNQQFQIYGVHYGWNFVTDADKGNARAGYCVGYLNPQFDPQTVTSFPTQVFGDIGLGELFFFDYARLPNEVGNLIDLSNPMIINGDRRITFVLSPPNILGGATGSVQFALEIRGEVTQLDPQDKPRLGGWVIR